MIKLNAQYNSLEKALDKVQDAIDKRRDEIESIEYYADEEDRDFTAKEQRRIDSLEEQIEELESEYDEIQNAMDYISEYCD